MTYGIRLRVSGDYGLFTRPEMKVERVSYDVITPSAARGILEAHGGSIWVQSEGHDEIKNPGSTFHILIPARAESPDPSMSKLFDTLGKKKEQKVIEQDDVTGIDV